MEPGGAHQPDPPTEKQGTGAAGSISKLSPVDAFENRFLSMNHFTIILFEDRNLWSGKWDGKMKWLEGLNTRNRISGPQLPCMNRGHPRIWFERWLAEHNYPVHWILFISTRKGRRRSPTISDEPAQRLIYKQHQFHSCSPESLFPLPDLRENRRIRTATSKNNLGKSMSGNPGWKKPFDPVIALGILSFHTIYLPIYPIFICFVSVPFLFFYAASTENKKRFLGESKEISNCSPDLYPKPYSSLRVPIRPASRDNLSVSFISRDRKTDIGGRAAY
jgi:hypothetical protein